MGGVKSLKTEKTAGNGDLYGLEHEVVRFCSWFNNYLAPPAFGQI